MKTATPVIASFILAVVLSATFAAAGQARASDMDASATALELVPRDKIIIMADEDFTTENGVVSGSGSSGDPYIIEGWEIVFNNSSTCITVLETSRHFIIRDVHLVGAMTGVRLSNLDHARVTEAVIENCAVGVSASYTDLSSVDNNLVSNCSIGISLRYCDEFSVDDNTYIGNTEDFRVVALPWITTRQANLVFATVALGLAALIGLLLYMRYKSGRPPEERP
jgi:parallel beta-helix repeat protein